MDNTNKKVLIGLGIAAFFFYVYKKSQGASLGLPSEDQGTSGGGGGGGIGGAMPMGIVLNTTPSSTTTTTTTTTKPVSAGVQNAPTSANKPSNINPNTGLPVGTSGAVVPVNTPYTSTTTTTLPKSSYTPSKGGSPIGVGTSSGGTSSGGTSTGGFPTGVNPKTPYKPTAGGTPLGSPVPSGNPTGGVLPSSLPKSAYTPTTGGAISIPSSAATSPTNPMNETCLCPNGKSYSVPSAEVMASGGVTAWCNRNGHYAGSSNFVGFDGRVKRKAYHVNFS